MEIPPQPSWMEPVEIVCEKTGYSTHLEFKLKPFLSGNEYYNLLGGKIKLGKETIASIHGHWDAVIKVIDERTEQETTLWDALDAYETRSSRLARFVVPLDHQDEGESEKLWRNVSIAILKGDQIGATEEKTFLEEAQRKAAKERQVKMEPWISRHFIQDPFTGEWIYKHADSRPWDPRTDVLQYERDFLIQNRTRHKTPMVAARTNSVISVDKKADERRTLHRPRLASSIESQASGESSFPDTNGSKRKKNRMVAAEVQEDMGCVQSRSSCARSSMDKQATFRQVLEPIQQCQVDCLKRLERMEHRVNEIHFKLGNQRQRTSSEEEAKVIQLKDVLRILAISFIVQFFIYLAWCRNKK